MAKKSWIKLDRTSSMDRPVTELFEATHPCEKHGEVYLSNALLGQHTGLNYRRRDNVAEIEFRCLRCRSRFVAQVNGFGLDDIPPFPDWAYEKARDAMFERGCKHSRKWMLSPIVLDRDGRQFRIIGCSTCRMRTRFDW